MDTGVRDAKHRTPESQALMLRALGYAGASYGGVRHLPEVLKHLDANGLKLFAVYLGLSVEPGVRVPPTLNDAIKILRGRETIIWLTINSRSYRRSSPAGDAVAVPLLRQLSDMAKEAGLRVALYPHFGTWIERVEDAVRVARKVGRGNVGATFNLCHWLRVGHEGNLRPLLQFARPHLFVVTINGADRGGTGWAQLIQTLDRGTFDNARLLATLREVGYTGPIGLQGYGIKGDVRDNLSRSMHAWRAICGKGEARPFTGDGVFEQIKSHESGKSRRAFSVIDDRLKLLSPEQREELEVRLGQILETPDATVDSKKELCRLLSRWGTARSVPALAALLADKRLSYMARRALHGKPYPGTDRALRQALTRVSDDLKPGIIATIAERRDHDAVPLLSKLAASPHRSVAQAAIRGLGEIGVPQAAAALASAQVADELTATRARSRLRCADRLLVDGDAATAASIFQELFDRNGHTPIRVAALDGLVRAQKERAVPLLLSLLKGRDLELRRAAVRSLTKVPGRAATQILADQLPQLAAGDKVVVLDALAVRGDKTAASAVAQVAGDEDPSVRTAAVRALGVIGDASHVRILANAASGESGKAGAAALDRLKAEGVDAAMVRYLREAPPRVQAVLVRSMVVRRSTGVLPLLFDFAQDEDASVRKEALKGLEVLAKEEDLPALVRLFSAMTAGRDVQRVEKVILKVVRRSPDSTECRHFLLAAYPNARPAVRAGLIRILARFGGRDELQIATTAVSDESDEVRDAAIRALANWPDAAPMDTLQKLAKDAPRQIDRLRALRGYIRMIGLHSDRPPAGNVARYRAAMGSAERPDEKKLILQALSEVADPGLLPLIDECMADENLRAAAAAAYLAVAKLAGATQPSMVESLLRQKMDAAQDEQFCTRAQEAIDWIKQCDGHITLWVVCGPYTGTPNALFAGVHPPEQLNAEAIDWQPVNGADGPFTRFITPGGINLGAIIGGTNRAAYLRTSVYSPEKRDAVLELGSDDAIKAWLNGKLVHSNNARRAMKPATDKTNVVLEKGWNVLLLKVIQATGEWGAGARFVNADGSKAEGLVVRP